MNANEFLNQLRHDDIVAAIREAEQMTSGEIRVFVSHRRTDEPIAAAQESFTRLGMNNTRERNGVLIFVAPRTRKFAVIGDAGIHKKCGNGFWQAVAEELSSHFKKAEFTEGVIYGVRKAGELLAQHFPRRPDDKNELPDRVAHD